MYLWQFRQAWPKLRLASLPPPMPPYPPEGQRTAVCPSVLMTSPRKPGWLRAALLFVLFLSISEQHCGALNNSPFVAALQPAPSVCWNTHPAPNGGWGRAYVQIKHPFSVVQTVIVSACVGRKVTAASPWSGQRIAFSTGAGEERGCRTIKNKSCQYLHRSSDRLEALEKLISPHFRTAWALNCGMTAGQYWQEVKLAQELFCWNLISLQTFSLGGSYGQSG